MKTKPKPITITITVKLSPVVHSLLATLAPDGNVKNVLCALIDHAQQGVYRPCGNGFARNHSLLATIAVTNSCFSSRSSPRSPRTSISHSNSAA